MKLIRLVILGFIFFGMVLASFGADAKSKVLSLKAIHNQTALRSPDDTVFFDDFESGAVGWTFQDIVITDTFWHISDTNAYVGKSFWCGTYARPGWDQLDYGYGDEWAQFLISPQIALTSVSGDTVLLTFPHRPSCESPGGPYPGDQWDGWDCLTVWVSNDDGVTWTPIFPDTTRWPGTFYNMLASWAWFWDFLAGEFDSIPGWGSGPNFGWFDIGFDLTPYKGQVIRLRFSGVSDPLESDQSGTNYDGMWYLDNIKVYDELNNTYFYEDCESGMGGWIAKSRDPLGNWWHLTTANSHSATHSFWCGDSLTGQMPLTGSYCALISPSFDLSDVSPTDPCIVDFWLNYQYLYQDDGYRIEVSSDNGVTWEEATPYYYNGSTNGSWVTHSAQYSPILLNNWVGYDSVRVRIITWNHLVSNPGYGLYLDDFLVTGRYPEFPKPEQVLIFDDDIGAIDVYGFGWQKYYESSLANIGYRFVTINAVDQGIPDSLYMRKNGMVIWNLGPKGKKFVAEEPIDPLAIAKINGYLRMGGKLLLVGEDYLYFNYPNPFADSVLSITGVFDDVGCDTIVGITGDPISNGINYPLEFGHLNGNGYGADYVDDFSTGATPVFLTNRTSNPIMLRKEEGNYRLIFSAFPIEAAATFQMRDTLLARIINWLDPTPPAPYLIKGTAHPPTGITIYWQANPPQDLAGYNIYRANVPAGPFAQIGTTNPSETTFVDTMVLLDSTYFYGVKAYDLSTQESGMSNLIAVTYQVGIKEEARNKKQEARLEISPNPFREKIEIRFTIHDAGYKIKDVGQGFSLAIYDATGRLVKQFNHLSASLTGSGRTGGMRLSDCIVWNGTDDAGRKLSAGVYFVQLESDKEKLTEKVIFLR